MQLHTERPAETVTRAAARPDPRTAAMLSWLVPGGGQVYCGALLTAPIFAGLAVFFVLSFLQAWDQWKRSALFLAIGALVVGLYAGNAFLSSRLAARRARRMERHAAIWRALGWWWRTGSATDSAFELALLFAFSVTCVGALLHWPIALILAEALCYWPVFELLGGFSVGFYAGFIDELEWRTANNRYATRSIVTGLILFQCTVAGGLYFVFSPPLLTVVAAGLLTLPGQVHTFIGINGDRREEAKLRAGSILIAVMLSFFIAFALASFFERPGVAKRDLAVFASMAMGAFYTLIRLLLDALVRKAKQNEAQSKAPQRA